jgi:hypothetical protein
MRTIGVTLQGEHLIVEVFAKVFNVTRFGKNFRKNSAI